jgi:hypothetical protein
VGDRLCFAFADGLFTLESLINLLKQAPNLEATFAFDLIGKFGHLSPVLWRLDDNTGKPSFHFLEALGTALKFRSASVASDQAVCLATLLGLRISSTHGAVPLIGDGKTPEHGMCELWRFVEAQNKGLPDDIIFYLFRVLRLPASGGPRERSSSTLDTAVSTRWVQAGTPRTSQRMDWYFIFLGRG